MTATSDREALSTGRPSAYSPGRIALTALVILAFMALGLVAGRWQWGRYETKSHALHAQELAAGLPTVPLDSIMTTADLAPGSADWRTVTVSGVIDATDVVQLRGRAIDTNASIQYLAWVHTSKGETVLLNLGWTPRSRPVAPKIPSGVVTITGTVRAFEPDNGRPGTRINPSQMGSFDGEGINAYLMVTSACSVASCLEGIEPVPLPELSTGPHLSYAMQWWLLLVAAAPIGVWLTVRDARLERERLAHEGGVLDGGVLDGGVQPDTGSDGPLSGSQRDPRRDPQRHPQRGAQRRPQRDPQRPSAKRSRPSDEEVEDAL